MTVNVITITYNNYTGLIKTGNSVLSQEFKKINWIVIDGASSDKTIEYMQGIQDTENIKVLFISEKDSGIYDAMNKGISFAKGDYTIFLNAGDSFSSNKVLCNIFNSLESTPKLIYGDYLRELKNNELALIKAKPLFYIYHSLPTSHQAIFYHNSVFQDLKYDLKYKICGDYNFTSEIVKKFSLLQTNDYKKLDLTVSIFEYNGVSRNSLDQLYSEAALIQKEIFELNVVWRITSYCLKYIRNQFL